jgi:hypothetical protein
MTFWLATSDNGCMIQTRVVGYPPQAASGCRARRASRESLTDTGGLRPSGSLCFSTVKDAQVRRRTMGFDGVGSRDDQHEHRAGPTDRGAVVRDNS